MALLESVPNVSEGCDAALVSAIGAAFASAGAELVDTHLDARHHRSVFTLLGEARALEDGLLEGIALAQRSIDLARHAGAHPRVGVVDVVPLVALATAERSRARETALSVARRVGDELGLPVFLYGEVADGRPPAFYRRGGLDELRRRVAAGELAPPAYGPATVDARSGAVLVGTRPPLVAYNVELLGSLEDARAIAATVRASSGGFPGVQALGLQLDDGVVQVSTNVVATDATAPHTLVEAIVLEAARRGAVVGAGELVGLLPASAVASAAAAAGVLGPLGADGLPTTAALGAAARALRLEALAADRVLEWHVARLART
jgi:glutamate formiminotransferase